MTREQVNDAFAQQLAVQNQLVRNQYAAPFLGGLSSGLGGVQQGSAGSLGAIGAQDAYNQYRSGALVREPKLHRYDAPTDTLVSVTQEWIDETTRSLGRMAMELKQAEAQIAILRALTTPVLEPAPSKTDYMWRCLVAAAG